MEKFNLIYEKSFTKMSILKAYSKTPFLKFKFEDFIKPVRKLYKEKDDVTLKICLVRYGARGDVLLLTPIIKKIKEKYKNINITVSTDYGEMLENNPNVDNIVPIKYDFSKFDRVYYMTYEFDSHIHIVQAYADQIGIEIDDYKPDLYLTEKEMIEAKRILDKVGLKNFFVLHTECDWQTRRWYGWNKLIEKLQEDKFLKNYSIIEVGKGESKFTPFNVSMIKHNNVRIIAAMIQYSVGLICIDSGIMHLGVALNKPVFSIFGITDPNKRLPEKWVQLATQHAGPTSGIHHITPPPVEHEPECKDQCIQDMKNLSEEIIFNKIHTFYKNAFVNFSIIIPSFGKFEYTYECVMSILRETFWSSNYYEIIITDDDSDSETVDRLKVLEGLCKILYNKERFGFTRNCNRASKEAKGNIIVLLNNDTKLLTKYWLQFISEDLDNDNIGIVGVKLLYPNMTIQHAGCIWDGKFNRHIYKNLPRNYSSACVSRVYDSVTGAFLAFRKKDWDKLNGFDENFNQSAEDTDFCFRVKYELKKEILYDSRVEFIHYEGITYGLEKEFDAHNVEYLRNKWREHLNNEMPIYYEREGNTPVVPPYRIEFGSGMDPNKGYIHVDIQSEDERGKLPHLEFSYDVSKPIPINDGKVCEILANHVIEHLGWINLVPVLTDWYRLLTRNGKLFIRTPNLEFIMNSYRTNMLTKEHPDDERNIKMYYGEVTNSMWANLKLFSGQSYEANFHNLCLDIQTLINISRRIGFKYCQPFEGREYSPGEIRVVLIK